ncbi:MAG: inositol monophosphatase family protein [Acidimicrobiales bacterium]
MTADLLALAVRLAGQAGDLLLAGVGERRRDVATKTSGTDMVTDMDRAAEALIVQGIRAARPHDAILGEEGADRAGTSGVRWVIDPLDGTTNYLYGHPSYAVSVAAEVDGDGLVGVVVDPSHGEVFAATAGGGATCNGRPITTSGACDLSLSLVGTGFSYLADVRARQALVLTHILPAVRDIRRNGAASLDLCWVACGRLDAYYEVSLQPWDVAAGLLIAREAGAFTAGVNGGPPSAASVLAASPALEGPLTALMAEAEAEAAGPRAVA